MLFLAYRLDSFIRSPAQTTATAAATTAAYESRDGSIGTHFNFKTAAGSLPTWSGYPTCGVFKVRRWTEPVKSSQTNAICQCLYSYNRKRSNAESMLFSMGKKLGYSILDVFAEKPLEGNPLAVFHDGRSLSSDEMQAIARETNLSETTFVLPSDNPEEDREHGVRVRIFTTQEELPFAGHPTLGTASWLHRHHPALQGSDKLTLRLKVGPIHVSFAAKSSEHGVVATMQQNDPVFGNRFSVEEIGSIIGMQPSDFLADFAPQSVSTGNAFCIVPLRSVEVLGRLAIPPRESAVWLREHGIRWFYCIAPEDEHNITAGRWRARMQFYSGEDPATGSAAGPCIAWLVKNILVASAESAAIRQGVEMQRPSMITAQATLQNESIHSVRVTGRTIPVAEGSFFLL